MNHLVISLIMFSVVIQDCAHQRYQVHIGQSFASNARPMTSYGSSAIAATSPDTVIELSGIYCDQNIFLDKYPAVRIYSSEKGKQMVPLSVPLMNCSSGDLIRITGKVINLPITYSIIKKTLNYNYLEPISFTTISDNQKVIELVNQEYRAIKADLQHKITIDQSMLQLSADPEWMIWYDDSEEIFIFHSHQFDLMYAADIEFIVAARTGKIKEVYAKEWFKGE